MSNIMIRWMQEKDSADLVELDNTIWNESNAPDPIHWDSAEEYNEYRKDRKILVAVMDDKVIGYVNFYRPTPLKSNRHVFEFNIGVNSNAQGLGVGKKLVESVIEEVRSLGARKLSLRVLSTNTSAIAFYSKLGFKEQGRLIGEFIISDKEVDDILMYKWI
ncbi:MAG: GNAT family N-acetyltransferase [Tuberibacillus sp.]